MLTAFGAALVLSGFVIDDYPQSLALELGAAVLLVVPLVFAEQVVVRTLSSRTARLESRLDDLSGDVQTLVAGLEVRGATDPAVEQTIRDSLRSFIEYTASLGIPWDDDLPVVDILSAADLRASQGPTPGIFDDRQNAVVISDDVTGNADYALREFSHKLLYDVHGGLQAIMPASDPTWATADGIWYLALESALASYLPCSVRGDHLFARIAPGPFRQRHPYMLDLSDPKTAFFDPRATSWPNHHSLGGAFAAAFWESRQEFSAARLDPVLARAWLDLRPAVDADKTFLGTVQRLDPEVHADLMAALGRRRYREPGVEPPAR